MTSVRRIYIGSRLRTSGTGSDFTYDVPKSFEIPDQTIAQVDCVLIPNVWGTIHDNNNRLYFSEWSDPNIVSEQIYTLPEGNYTGQQLAQLVQDTISATTILTQAYSVSYDEKTGMLTISNPSGNFAIPTRHQLISLSKGGLTWAAQSLDQNDLRDCHDVIGFNSSANDSVNGVLVADGYVDLLPYRCILLCSSSIGNPGTVVGPVGQDTIIRRIPISSGFGSLIYDAHSTAADYIDVSQTQISQLHFRLTDERGRTIPMNGHGISFSICFMEKAIV